VSIRGELSPLNFQWVFKLHRFWALSRKICLKGWHVIKWVHIETLSCQTPTLKSVISFISVVFAIFLVYWVFFQTGTSLTITILVDYLLFYVPLRNFFHFLTFADERRQILALGSGSLSREKFLSPTPIVTRGLNFFFFFLLFFLGGGVSSEGPTHSVHSWDA
jgi:hypothetical protein